MKENMGYNIWFWFKVVLIILFVYGLFSLVVGYSQSCEEYINDYIQENNLSSKDIYTNNQGYWSIEKDEEQLTNCLEKGGKMDMYFPLE